MELPVLQKFENMCRTCMTTENDSLQSLFDYLESKETYIFELINSTIHQLPKIEHSDELPKAICGNCLVKFSSFYEFQKCCIATDKNLRQLIVGSLSDSAAAVLDDLQEGENKQFDFLNVEAIIKEDKHESSSVNLDVSNDDEAADECVASNALDSDVGDSDYELPLSDVKLRSTEKNRVQKQYVTCETCDKIFASKKYLNRHIKRMHPDKFHEITQSQSKPIGDSIFKCDECGSEFGKKVNLRKHKYRHKRPGGMKISKKCDYCDMVFHTSQALKKHCETHPESISSTTKKPYVCEYCNKGFQQSCTLKDHKRIHTNEAPYLCSDCGKAFKSNSNLKQHLLRHTGEKRYECPECPKKFPCLSDLCSHRQVHKKIRPHVCDTCGAAFGKYSQLKKHNMYHSGEKPYQCEYCEMRFVCADHMRRHMRTHTGEKPYSCKYCPRSFTQSNDMVKHLRSHLGVNVYLCELCPAAFRLAAELREHFSLHKNDDEETRDRNKRELMKAQEKLRQKLEQDNGISGPE